MSWTTIERKAPVSAWIKRLVLAGFVVAGLALAAGSLNLRGLAAFGDGGEGQGGKVTRNDCSYLKNPEKFDEALADHRELVSKSTETLADGLIALTDAALVAPQDMPRKNFIDNILFDRMARENVMSAQICTDEEFIRRAYLDLTGRIPSADDVTAFLRETSAGKRDALVDRLIGTPEYVDKWTMFYSDLFKVTARSTNVTRYTGGRDAFFTYIKNSISANKSYAQMATEMITANGDNFASGEVNWVVGGIIPMGPVQDTMDGTAVNASQMFLGIQSLDCLFCHSGAGHLDAVNLWGSQRTRDEAWGMGAFFARTLRQRQVLSQQPLYIKYNVSERTVGEYLLNTDTGNRTARQPHDGMTVVSPRYILGGAAPGQNENRRQALARMITSDRQFARAAVNYVWEKIMVEALVSPSNAFDPARLDPKAPLPAGWSLQPANAELLESLSDDFIKSNYNLQKLIATIVKSSAYQLSSQYPGPWNLSMIPYYARKYVRRLDAEEIHDAILKATGIGVSYQMRDNLGNPTYTVNWAMQLPDTIEPRGNPIGLSFLNSFIRGDRDVKPRSLEPSILQALNLMNNQFVMSRIHQANAGSRVSQLLANTSLTPEQVVTQLYLGTLARNPIQSEMDALTPLFTSMGRRQAAEAIQWALINKMDFVFNY